MTDPPAAIVLQHIYKSYARGPDYVIQDVSLSIAQGEFFCLVGASGCGKSTLIKIMAGIESPSKGSVAVHGCIGMVFQSYALLPWLTVTENVAFAARMHGFDKGKTDELTATYLEMVHLQDFAARYPRELSGGQRQRVGLARALAVEPSVLLLDEPFSALDPLITEQLHADLLEIWERTQATIVLVSHHFDEAVLLADRIGVISEGRLTQLTRIALDRPRRDDAGAFIDQVHRLRASLLAKASPPAT